MTTKRPVARAETRARVCKEGERVSKRVCSHRRHNQRAACQLLTTAKGSKAAQRKSLGAVVPCPHESAWAALPTHDCDRRIRWPSQHPKKVGPIRSILHGRSIRKGAIRRHEQGKRAGGNCGGVIVSALHGILGCSILGRETALFQRKHEMSSLEFQLPANPGIPIDRCTSQHHTTTTSVAHF